MARREKGGKKMNEKNVQILIAVKNGNISMVEKLLEEGVSPDTEDENGNNLLKIAAYTGRSRIADILAKNGANCKINGFSEMIMAAITEDTAKIIFIARNKKEALKDTDTSGNTPLVFSILNWNYEAAGEIIDAMENVDSVNKFGNTPLILAAERGNTRVVRKLIARGAKVNALNKVSETALIYACSNGYADIVTELLHAGANPSIKNKYDDCAMIYAALSGNSLIIRRLASVGADVNVQGFWGKTPLMIAALKGHPEAVRELINLGADVEMKDRYGYTALMEAVGEVNVDVLKVYVDQWKKNGHNHTEHNLPIEAAKEGYIETVKELLEAGADTKNKDEGGLTAYDHARDDEMREALENKRNTKKDMGGIQSAH